MLNTIKWQECGLGHSSELSLDVFLTVGLAGHEPQVKHFSQLVRLNCVVENDTIQITLRNNLEGHLLVTL